MSGLKAYEAVSLAKSIKDGFPGADIKKWVSEEDHEDIVLETAIGRVEIKFYPEEGENK